MEFFQVTMSQIIIFIIYILVGVYAAKRKILNQERLDAVSKVIINITFPFMLFHTTLSETSKNQFMNALPIILIVMLMYITLFITVLMLRRMFKLTGETARLYQVTTMFGNTGFMGIPIIRCLLPGSGMIYMALYTVADQLIFWTLGMYLLDPGGGRNLTQNLKKIINPQTIAIVLAILCVFFGVELPYELDESFQKIGNITTPLAMIYTGGLFCYTDIKGGFRRKEYYGAVLVKMILLPVIFFSILQYIPFINQDMRILLTVISSMPSMASVAMIANAKNMDGTYPAAEVFFTTLCSVVTLPLIILLTL